MNPRKQQVAIVTGANSGIGAEIAKKLAKKGISVVIHFLENKVFEAPNNTAFEHTDNGRAKALEVRDEIKYGNGKAEIFGGDLADTTTIARLVNFAEETFGTPTILINNAAHCELPDTILETTSDTIDRHFIVNTRSPVLLIKEVSRRIIDKNLSFGRIINISTDGAQCFPSQISYGASKAALEAYTRSLAIELGEFNITVNSIAPGPIQTGWINEELEEKLLKNLPIKRLGLPKDIANTISFLISEKASWITGQIIKVSGGHNI